MNTLGRVPRWHHRFLLLIQAMHRVIFSWRGRGVEEHEQQRRWHMSNRSVRLAVGERVEKKRHSLVARCCPSISNSVSLPLSQIRPNLITRQLGR